MIASARAARTTSQVVFRRQLLTPHRLPTLTSSTGRNGYPNQTDSGWGRCQKPMQYPSERPKMRPNQCSNGKWRGGHDRVPIHSHRTGTHGGRAGRLGRGGSQRTVTAPPAGHEDGGLLSARGIHRHQGAKVQDEARQFSQSVFDQSDLDGIRNLSRLTRRTCVAVYDGAMAAKLNAGPVQELETLAALVPAEGAFRVVLIWLGEYNVEPCPAPRSPTRSMLCSRRQLSRAFATPLDTAVAFFDPRLRFLVSGSSSFDARISV